MSTLIETSSTPSSTQPQQACGGKAGRLFDLASLSGRHSLGFQVPEFVVSPQDVAAVVERLGTPLAVRSSASVEDGAEISFAGQFRSFLNLTKLAEVIEAVRLCRESKHEPSVIDYCRKNGIDPKTVRMDVIIQRMIQPEVAGVVFTVNPMTGVEEITIEACTGLADELLSGRQ